MEKRLRQRLSTLRNSLSGHLFFERYPDAGARQVEWEWRKSAALALDSRDSGAWRCLTTTSRPNSAGSAARMANAPSNMAVSSHRRPSLLEPRPGGNHGPYTGTVADAARARGAHAPDAHSCPDFWATVGWG